jgi:hypothetical protein
MSKLPLTFRSARDAFYGNGVYLTALSPDYYTKDDIITNNWDDGPARVAQ